MSAPTRSMRPAVKILIVAALVAAVAVALLAKNRSAEPAPPEPERASEGSGSAGASERETADATDSSGLEDAGEEAQTAFEFIEASLDSPKIDVSDALASSLSDVAEHSLPTLVDLGADKCIPCKMMAPILVDLRNEYAGEFNVVFVDVWKHPEKKKEYDVALIPTQVFLDAEGRELFRHEGFYSKEQILAKWKELGVLEESESASGKAAPAP